MRISRSRSESSTPAHNYHGKSRRWWAPWTFRCRCGIDWWPCPVVMLNLSRRAQDADTADCGEATPPPPAWDGPTIAVQRPLTLAQLWRGNGGRWSQQ